MSDLGDIFDMFPQGDDEKKQRKAEDGESQENSKQTDIKSLVLNKLSQNKAILITVICIALLILGAVAYFLIGYINEHGTKSIIDNVKPFIK